MLKFKISLKFIYTLVIFLLIIACFFIALGTHNKYKNSKELSLKIQSLLEYVSLEQINTIGGEELISSWSATGTDTLIISPNPFKTFIKEGTTIASGTPNPLP